MTSAHGITHDYSPGEYIVIIEPKDSTKFFFKFGNGASSYFPTGAGRLITECIQTPSFAGMARWEGTFASCNKLCKLHSGCKIPEGVTSANGIFSTASGWPTVDVELNNDFTLPSTLTSAQYTFGNYALLIRHIPQSCQLPPNCKNFFYFMHTWTASIVTVPANWKLPAVATNCERMFNNQSLLEFDISNFFPNEWANGGYTCNIKTMFTNCAKITGTVPTWIFDGTNNLTHGTDTFKRMC